MWDNYIANNSAMDPGNLWPMNLDIDSMGAVNGMQQQPQTGEQQPQQQQGNTGTNSGLGSVFMGAAMAPNQNNGL
jgi:hypothetical protein